MKTNKKAILVILACISIALLWLSLGSLPASAQQASTDTPTETPTPLPTDTPTPEFTSTPADIATDTLTATPPPTDSITPSDTPTPTETPTTLPTDTGTFPIPFIANDMRFVPPEERQSVQPMMLFASASAPSSHLPGQYDTSVFMHGSVSVGVIFPQCNGVGVTCTENAWTAAQISNVENQIQYGMDFWSKQATAHSDSVSFVYDWKTGIQVPYEPINVSSASENTWEDAALTAMGYSGTTTTAKVYNYVNALREANHTDWAVAIFVVNSLKDTDGKFPDGYFAWSMLGGPYLVMTYDNDGWGISSMQWVTAHEIGHTFLAGDQYYMAGYGGCAGTTEKYGYLGIANSNCENGNPNPVPSIMLDNSNALDTSAAQQVGWKDSNSNTYNDPLDTFPGFSVAAHAPNPTGETSWTYSGFVYDVPWPHANCIGPEGYSTCWYRDITLNTITSVQYRVDGGGWNNVPADDGAYDSDVEGISFSTGILASGQHLIELQATNSKGNISSWSDSVLVASCSPLTLSAYPAYGGTLTTLPAPNCGGSNYYDGTSISLKAVPRTGATFQNWSGGASGSMNPYIFTISGTTAIQANFFAPPGLPTLLAPVNGAFSTSPTPLFDWSDTSPAADHYEILIASDSGFTNIVQSRTDLTTSSFTPTALASNSTFYWKVRAVNSIGQASNWTAYRSVRIALSQPTLAAPGNGATVLLANPMFSWGAITGAATYTLNVSLYSNFSTLTVNVTTVATSYIPPVGLPAGKILYWRVRANNTSGSSAWAPTWQFTSAMPPSIPILVSPSNNGLLTNYLPRLDWNNSTIPAGTSFDHYRLQVASDAAFSALILDQNISGLPTNSEYTFTSALNPNTKYYWRVNAFNAGGQYSAWSLAWTFRTALTAPKLLAPASGNTTLSTRPTFSWNPVTGATGYTLQASLYSNFSILIQNVNVTGASYTPTSGLTQGKLIYWRVRANGTNGPSLWSETWLFTSANPPSAPGLVSPGNSALTTNYKPTLDWNNSSVPAGTVFDHYHLQVATDLAFTSLVIDQDVAGPVTNSVFIPSSDFNSNTKYYWRVNAFNASGQYSQWSPVYSFRTALTAPILIGPAGDSTAVSTKPLFSWNVVPGATNYTFQVSLYASFSSLILNTTATGNSYTPAYGLPQGKLIYWRVRANGTNGPSLWSSAWQFSSANPPSAPGLVSPPSNSLQTNYQPVLDWNNSSVPLGTTFDHYHIQVATDAGFSGLAIDQDVPGPASNSTFTPSAPLAANTKYYWRVNAFNTTGQFSAWSVTWYFRTALVKPVLVSPVSGSPVACAPVTLDWSDVGGVSSYTLFYATSPTFSTYTAVTSTPSVSVRTITTKTTYYWKVRANGTNGPSLWSDTWSFTCTP